MSVNSHMKTQVRLLSIRKREKAKHDKVGSYIYENLHLHRWAIGHSTIPEEDPMPMIKTIILDDFKFLNIKKKFALQLIKDVILIDQRQFQKNFCFDTPNWNLKFKFQMKEIWISKEHKQGNIQL